MLYSCPTVLTNKIPFRPQRVYEALKHIQASMFVILPPTHVLACKCLGVSLHHNMCDMHECSEQPLPSVEPDQGHYDGNDNDQDEDNDNQSYGPHRQTLKQRQHRTFTLPYICLFTKIAYIAFQ